MNYDPYTHTAIVAVKSLTESQSQKPILTWDGATNYRVQSGLIPLDEGHAVILTRNALIDFCDGKLTDDNLIAAASWVEGNKSEWLQDAQEEE